MSREDRECPACGYPLDSKASHCPKCDESLRQVAKLGVLEVDVAHSGESWEMAREKIERAVDQALLWGHAGLKVIHGQGSSTGRAVIAPRAVALMKELAARTGGTFTRDRNNPGAHLIWFN